MSLAGPPVYYFLSLSSVAVLNMEGGAGARLKGKGGEWCWAILRSWFVILRPRAVAESHSRGFGAKPGGVYVCYWPYARVHVVYTAELRDISSVCVWIYGYILYTRVSECGG